MRNLRIGAPLNRTIAICVTGVLLLAACAGPDPSASPSHSQGTDVQPRDDDPVEAGPAKILQRKVTYAERGGEKLRFDVFRTSTPTTQPVLVVMHGGLWWRRAKKLWAPFVPRMVKAGYVVVLPDVRLSPPGGDTLFPEPFRDLSRSIAWLRRHALELGGDPRQLALIGSSSGAHLALLAAGTGAGRPDAVVVYSPSIDLADLHARNITRRGIENHLGCVPADCGEAYELASPLFVMDRRTPPTLLAYSRDEVMPREHGIALRDRLRSLGVVHRVIEVPGKVHGLKLAHKVLAKSLDFIERHLGRRTSEDAG